jgi:hypothetical protein
MSVEPPSTADLDRVLAGTYGGSDPAGLAAATVDGRGLVVEVTFVKTIARHPPAAIGAAVRAAIGAAQQRLAEAFDALTAPPAEGAVGTALGSAELGMEGDQV